MATYLPHALRPQTATENESGPNSHFGATSSYLDSHVAAVHIVTSATDVGSTVAAKPYN